MTAIPIQRTLVVCHSTNDEARKLALEGASHGSWVSCDRQTRGRGRSGHVWESAEGNLFLSIVVRLQDRSRWTWIPLVTGLGMVDFLERATGQRCYRIKWPNDVWAHGRKLAGVLCEAHGNVDNGFVVVGVGLNCFSSPVLPGSATPAISLRELGCERLASEIRGAITESILRRINALADYGAHVMTQEYLDRAQFPVGSRVRWNPTQGERQQGEVLGLGDAGELLVRLDEGGVKAVFAEEVYGVHS